MSRRFVSYVLAVALLLVTATAAQQPAAPLKIASLAPSVYWAQGGAGGNSGIIVGKTSVIVIDAKMTPDAAKQMLAEIAKLTPKPVTHVILTHSDADHVNGLAAFPAGTTVVAHANARQELETTTGAPGAMPLAPDRLPTKLIARTGENLTIADVNFELHHWAPAHTSGDLIVYLPDQKIVFTGDIIATNRPDPLIHFEKHGSSEGWITTVKGLLGLSADRFVPGHGDVQSRAEVQTRLIAAMEKRDKIAALVREGKSLDEVKAAVGDPPSPPMPSPAAPAASGAPGRGQPGVATFTEVVFQELTRRQ